jgi:hypothetical protein
MLTTIQMGKTIIEIFTCGTEDPHNQYSEDNKDNIHLYLSHLKQQQKFAKYELIKSITITNLQHLTQACIPKSHLATFYTKFLSVP